MSRTVSAAGAPSLFGHMRRLSVADYILGNLHWTKYHDKHLDLPDNFVAIGDATMKVNPVFG